MRYKIFVINLKENTSRWTFMTSQLQRLQLPFERINAVRGNALAAADEAVIYPKSSHTTYYPVKLSAGEIGCYLSHIQCWQQLIEQDLDFALILEDDALLPDNLHLYLTQASHYPKDWDYIELSSSRRCRPAYATVADFDAFKLVKRKQLHATTTGQLVSRQGAIKLQRHALPMKRPIDIDLQYVYEKSTHCYSVDPLPITGADFQSHIASMGRRSKPWSALMKQLWFRVQHRYRLYQHFKHVESLKN
ncbi:MAG: glycosyltransferase family 25 protein [Shewanellaceae bacterium]|nr:glycosyltransferase family 25 protein [Shewanellaceae bacterium]